MSSLGSAIGVGIDILFRSDILQSIGNSLSSGVGVTLLVIFTGVCFFRVVRYVMGNIRGLGDVSAALQLAWLRVHAFGHGPMHHAWGRVTDAQTGRSVALAVVTLSDASHRVLVSMVSDHDGRYGFRMPLADALRMHVASAAHTTKEGFHTTVSVLSLHTGAMPDTLDIMMHPR
jgi:hypothetical protein